MIKTTFQKNERMTADAAVHTAANKGLRAVKAELLLHKISKILPVFYNSQLPLPACAKFLSALTPCSSLCSDSSASYYTQWVLCQTKDTTYPEQKEVHYNSTFFFWEAVVLYRKHRLIVLCSIMPHHWNKHKKYTRFHRFFSFFLPVYPPKALTCLPPLCCTLLQLRACLPACVYFWKLTTWPTCALLLLVHHHSFWPVKARQSAKRKEEKTRFGRHSKQWDKPLYELIMKPAGGFHSGTIGHFWALNCLWSPHTQPPSFTTHLPFDDDGHTEYLFLEKRHWGQSKTKGGEGGQKIKSI